MKIVSINTYKAFLDEVKAEALLQGWTSERDTDTGLRELILRSPNDAIVGFKEHSNFSSYYNVLLNFATDFDNTKTFYQQPGSLFNYPDNSSNTNHRAPLINLHDNTMNLFIFVNVNRIIVVSNALSKYVSLYIGRYLRNGTAGQIPNNLFAGGSGNSANLTSDLSSTSLSCFYNTKSDGNNNSIIKDEIDENIQIRTSFGTVFPFNYFTSLTVSNHNIKDRDGKVVLYPSILTVPNKNLGELDGVFFLSSIDGIAPENELELTTTEGTFEYKIFIDTNNITNNHNFYAVRI